MIVESARFRSVERRAFHIKVGYHLIQHNNSSAIHSYRIQQKEAALLYITKLKTHRYQLSLPHGSNLIQNVPICHSNGSLREVEVSISVYSNNDVLLHVQSQTEKRC
ncbi:uncharacterized protein LOC133721222 isoform X2 [Rosa rugosa]|uniref:uncharacterized protein LOC133721222 isoform X2 n=1 Tax=Rosa rugosa TaxID=74645 RepID=UPI002B40B712|nr:uncharacterized protein LOC133721222 isoform X2 [Rosa rugosa]